jgi:thiol-disulfide isomerase/thioredoxin
MTNRFTLISVLLVLLLLNNAAATPANIDGSALPKMAQHADSLWKEGTVFLHGRITNHSAGEKVVTLKHTSAITNVEEINVCRINSHGQFSIRIKTSHIVPEFRLIYGERNETFFARPGDTVGVYIDCSNPTEAGLVFSGNRKKLQNELRKFSRYFTIARRSYDLAGNIRSLDEHAFKLYRSAVKVKDDSVLNAYGTLHGVSAELQSLVILDNRYSWARDLVGYSAEHAPPLFTKVDEGYYNFVDDKLLNDAEAFSSPNYIRFLNLYQSDILLSDNRQDLPIADAVGFALRNDHSLNDNARAIFRKFSSNKGSLDSKAELDSLNKYIDNDFINRFNQAYLVDLNYKKLNELMVDGTGKQIALSIFLYDQLSANNIIEDSILYRFSRKVQNHVFQRPVFDSNILLSSRINKSLSAETFNGKTIASIPEKTLETILSKYIGKIVYVDFWATWCQPCLQEMKKSAALKEKFKDVVFLYLCEKSPEGRWRFVVQDQGVTGEHFLLTSPQSDYLSRKFAIHTVPRYFLVDQRGQIFDDNAPYPSSEEAFKKLNYLQGKIW